MMESTELISRVVSVNVRRAFLSEQIKELRKERVRIQGDLSENLRKIMRLKDERLKLDTTLRKEILK